MSLDSLDAKITRLREQSSQTHLAYQGIAQRVNADESLSLVGRAERINTAREAAAKKVEDLREQETRLVVEHRRNLERRITGTVGRDVISYRDARDRASRITDRKVAATAMHDALLSRDDELAGALLDFALDRHFAEAVDEYMEAHPATAEIVDDLYSLISRTSSPMYKMMSGLSYVVPR